MIHLAPAAISPLSPTIKRINLSKALTEGISSQADAASAFSAWRFFAGYMSRR